MQRGGEVVLQPLGEDVHVGECATMTAAMPLMLAVIDSKIRFRSRARIVSAATRGDAEYHPCGQPRRPERSACLDRAA